MNALSAAPSSDAVGAGAWSVTGRHVPVVCALALVALHFLWLTAHFVPAIMSPDANGYVVQARLIAEEGRTSFSPGSPALFVGMHWLETESGVFHSRYPAGLPLTLAAAWKIGGIRAALLVNPLLASATVLLVFLLARRLMSDSFAVVAALVVAGVPVTNQHALDADAHVAAAFLLVAGVLALLRFEEGRSPMAGFIAGLMLGAIPSVRYPEAIAGVTLGAWMVWRIRPWWRMWPTVAGAALPLVALCAHNAAAYGAFWRTGYALTHEQPGFGFSYFASHALPYLQALGGQGLALMFGFGAAGIAALAADARYRREGVLFAGITVPLVLLYMAYYSGGGGIGGAVGNLRFLIPIFPFFAVAGAWMLMRLSDHPGLPGRAAVVAVVALQVIIGVAGSQETLAQARLSLRAAERARSVANREIPTGSVVIVERQLAESLDATGQWKLVEENLVSGGGPVAGGMMGAGIGNPGGRPGLGGRGAMPPLGGELGTESPDESPSPQQRGKNRAQLERYSGLPSDQRRERVWADVKTWAAGKPIFWFARNLDAMEATLPAGADYRTVAELDAPMMLGPGGAPGPGMPGRGGGPGRGMMPGRGMGPGQPGPTGGRGFGPPGASAGRRGGFPGVSGNRLRVLRIEFAP